MKKIKMNIGDYSEGSEIIFDLKYENDYKKYHKLCKHVVCKQDYFVVPKVIKAYNEGGFCHTIVCIDCINEQLNER